MTATEDIRHLLDERGVEYRTRGTTDRTWFEVGCISWFICERENGNLTADAVFLTPEQAVEVTLGVGTCHADETDTMECVCNASDHYGESLTVHVMECSVCGRTYEHVWGNYEYCPHCGRRIKEEDE